MFAGIVVTKFAGEAEAAKVSGAISCAKKLRISRRILKFRAERAASYPYPT
jgi:hypothetical protein